MIHHANGTHDLFGWIERDQYVYYLTIAYMLSDPADWPTFRRAVYGGLQAALGLTPPPPTGPHPDPRARPDPAPQQHAFALLDDLRNRYDPAINEPVRVCRSALYGTAATNSPRQQHTERHRH